MLGNPTAAEDCLLSTLAWPGAKCRRICSLSITSEDGVDACLVTDSPSANVGDVGVKEASSCKMPGSTILVDATAEETILSCGLNSMVDTSVLDKEE